MEIFGPAVDLSALHLLEGFETLMDARAPLCELGQATSQLFQNGKIEGSNREKWNFLKMNSVFTL
jgi:hypothetical protein